MDYIKKVSDICANHKLNMHLDGARALNAATFLNIDPSEMVKPFKTFNFCLSKGMGCPIGSMIVSSREMIDHAIIVRKMLGGAMRQVGVLGACGLVALEDWKPRF